MKSVASRGSRSKLSFNKSSIKLKDNRSIIQCATPVHTGVRVFDKMEIVNEDRIERIGVQVAGSKRRKTRSKAEATVHSNISFSLLSSVFWLVRVLCE